MKIDGSWESPSPGIKRRLHSLGNAMMTMEVLFETNAIGAEHKHPHEQHTVVLEGRFSFTVGTNTHLLQTGDALFIPSNAVHGCVCLQAGRLLDTFTPIRHDLLEA
jgi:quercetin dioxygenase-like cupin family protein